MTGDTSAVVLVRLRFGVVGEARRVVHVVPFPRVDDEILVAYCGQALVPMFVQVLRELTGMPCELCLANAPDPAGARHRLALTGGAHPPDLA